MVWSVKTFPEMPEGNVNKTKHVKGSQGTHIFQGIDLFAFSNGKKIHLSFHFNRTEEQERVMWPTSKVSQHFLFERSTSCKKF